MLIAILRAGAASIFASLLLCTVGSAAIENTRGEEDPNGAILTLELAHPIEAQLTAGGEQTYKLVAHSGQFVLFRVAAENPGSNLQVTVFDPGDRKIEELSGPVCPFPLSLIVIDSGTYRVRVQLLHSDTAPEKYKVEVQEQHESTERDRMRVAASRALVETFRFSDSADSEPQVAQKSQEAIASFRAAEDRRGEAEVFQVLSRRSFMAGNYQAAADYLQQARELWHALGEYGAEASILYRIANYLGRIGESEKTLAALNDAIELEKTLGNRWGEAMALDSLSDAYDSRGELQEALNAKRRALSVFREDKTRMDYEFTALADVGHIYEELGESQKALDYDLQALRLARSRHRRDLEISMLSVVAGAHAEAGDKNKALEYYNEALRLAQGDRGAETWTQSKLANFYLSRGEYDKALQLLNQILPYFHAENARVFEATTLYGIGVACHRQGKLPQALEVLTQALSIWKLNNRMRREILREMGSVYQDLGDSQKAVEYYEKSLADSRSAKDLQEEALALCDLARSERAMRRLPDARRDVESGLRILESLRARISGTEARASYFSAAQTNFEFYIDLLMQMHAEHPDEGLDATALQVSESTRARSLLDMLSEAHANIHQGADPQLLQHEKLLQQRLRARSEYQVRLLSQSHTQEQAAAVTRELQALAAQYDETETQIRVTSPRYAALTQPQPLDVKQIQQQVLDPDTLLLEYSLGDERSYLWAVTDTALASFVLPKRADIEQGARQVYELLTVRSKHPKGEDNSKTEARIARAHAEYPAAAGRLSDMILRPAASLLGHKRLLIVSDGALQYIPFAALPAPTRAGGASQPLVVETETVTIPSASTLALVRRDFAGRLPAPKTVAVLADPVFDRLDPRVATRQQVTQVRRRGAQNSPDRDLPADLERSWGEVDSAGRAAKIPRLPFSRREADAIMADASPGDSFEAVDFRASRATVTSPELAQYKVIHLATHGVLDSRTPALSGIVLSLVDWKGKSVDGFLRVWDIYNLHLPAELVVLSACQTALGAQIKGEGLVGMTRGFMYAGSARVIASLWQVNDVASSELMAEFYRNLLKKNLPPAAALRAAQVYMWKQKRWQGDPYFWGAFQLQGEWK